MNRRSFVERLVLASAVGWFPKRGEAASLLSGDTTCVRRLSSSKTFTRYLAGMEPAYTVKLGELVLVECLHSLPGNVTRDGKFSEPKPDDPVNPGTGPIAVEGIEAGDALAIDILDIRDGDWGYSGGRIY